MTEQQMIRGGLKEDKKTFEYLWNKKIEPNFKWENVHQAMKAFDWHWGIDISKDLYGIPQIDTLKQKAKNLLFEAYKVKKGTMSSGGFTASYEDGDLRLSFVLEEISTRKLTA